MGGRHFQRLGLSPTLGSFGPLSNGTTSPGCHSRVLLVPLVLQTLLMEMCATTVALNSSRVEIHMDVDDVSETIAHMPLECKMVERA